MELLDRLAKEDPAIGKAKQVLEQMASIPGKENSTNSDEKPY